MEVWESDMEIPHTSFSLIRNVSIDSSPVFSSMFDVPMVESSRNEVIIEDMNTKTLELMLQFIYKGEIQDNFPLDFKSRFELLDSAEKYQLAQLKSECFQKIFSHIDHENAGELAMTAFTYNLEAERLKIIQNYCMQLEIYYKI